MDASNNFAALRDNIKVSTPEVSAAAVNLFAKVQAIGTNPRNAYFAAALAALPLSSAPAKTQSAPRTVQTMSESAIVVDEQRLIREAMQKSSDKGKASVQVSGTKSPESIEQAERKLVREIGHREIAKTLEANSLGGIGSSLADYDFSPKIPVSKPE